MSQTVIEIPPLPQALERFRLLQAAMNRRDEEEATIADLLKEINQRREIMLMLDKELLVHAVRLSREIPEPAEAPLVWVNHPAVETLEQVTVPVPILDKTTGATLMGHARVAEDIAPETMEAIETMVQCAYDAATEGTLGKSTVKATAPRVCRQCGAPGRALCYACTGKMLAIKKDEVREDLEGFDVILLREILRQKGITKESFSRELGITNNFDKLWQTKTKPSRHVTAILRERFPEAFTKAPEPTPDTVDTPPVAPAIAPVVNEAPTSPLPPLPAPKTFNDLFPGAIMHGWGKDEQAIKDALVMGVEIFKGAAFKVVKCPTLGFIPESINYLPTPPVVAVCKATRKMDGWGIVVMPGGLK